jgi:outer membrane protein OmpA-like peptidoglycan-associated protein
MNTSRLLPVSAAIVTVLAFGSKPGTVAAAEGEGVTVETFRPSTSADSLFELTLPATKEHLDWHLGGLVHYGHHPVRRELVYPDGRREVRYPLAGRVTADLFASLGLFGWLEAGLALPVVAFQYGEGWTPPPDPADPDADGGRAQPAGLGDPRLQLKARFLEAGGFQLGAGAVATAPLGHYASSGEDLLGSAGPTVEPQLLASFGAGPLTVGLDAGFLVRPRTSMGDWSQDHALTWNLGLAFDVRDFHEPGGVRLAVETNGEAGIGFSTLRETPMELLAGVKVRTRRDLIFVAGAGPGLTEAVGTPLFRVFAGIAFDDVLRSCPEGEEDYDGFQDDDKCIDPDNDGDGILDGEDACPNEAEDFDGFEDGDGCPDPDNDGDGIPDAVDRCPMLAEDRDGFEDEDGCPEEGPGRPLVTVTDSQILISSKIYFDYNKAEIKAVSHGILDAVAEALLQNPQIGKVRVEGHTDNEGTDAYNLDLSSRRAAAVVEYLKGRGVPEERLTSEGFGFTRPKASNRTEEGRAINRRVEFTIVKE